MIHADFVHLHVHTQYSLLDGACHLERLVDRARQYKLPALAITDHGNLYGAIKFYTACMKAGVKPIIGCEVYVAPDSRFNREYKQSEPTNNHLILLAKNETGYRNLLKLTSLGFLEGFYYKPRIDQELIEKHHEGLIALSACLKGKVASCALSADTGTAFKCADEYLNIFGKGNFYLEVMENGLPEQKKVNRCLTRISKDLGIPLVATNDVHYLGKDESFAHEVLLCIQTQTTMQDTQRFKFGSNTFYFREPAEMKKIFSEFPGACANTLEIMQKCNLTFDFSKTHLPHFPLPEGESDDEYLRKLCYEKAKRRYPKLTMRVTERMEYELDVIKKTGFSSYFLIIWDLITFSKENHIPVGPGRGSAAGSIVSYILGITDIDPLKYNLIFERFLNPERISMPDIDIDFCYEKRAGVIEYVGNRYGHDNVAQIITFGTMLARAVVRDVGRVMDFSYSDVDKIAKMIPSAPGAHVSLKEALEISPELYNMYKSDDAIKRLIDVAMQLEGLSRHASTHAAGVVISDKPLMERIPLIKGSQNEVITGFDMDSLEKTGLLKMDFLGLKTLTVIDQTLRIIKRTRNLEIDINAIPLDDKKTFALLGRGDSVGVFQLESRGMRELLKKITPSRFEDLIAILALYRPGPLGSGMVQDYIERKHGNKPITYIHPRLEKILKETYGIILYQEQTMQIASVLAGFSLSQADLLRKAIGKKIPEIMQEQKERFVGGCRKNKIAPHTATKIFDLIDYFSGYGFNKSHSTAYAMISYRTAYLKANFGVEFMAALLTSERNNTDKVVEYVNEANRMGVEVLPPDINESFANFTVTTDANIRFGLMAIKNVGGAALDNIVRVRLKKRFENFTDFFERVETRAVNKKVIESLIKSGAMDSFGYKRAQMMVMMDRVLEKASRKSRDAQQVYFFEEPRLTVEAPDIEEWPMSQILTFEKKLLGMYVSSHPLKQYERYMRHLGLKSIAQAIEPGYQQDITVLGVIEKVKLTTTRKRNERMAITRVEDQTGNIEVFVFPRVYERCASAIIEQKIVAVKGKLQLKDKVPKILAEEVIPVESIFKRVRQVKIIVNKGNDNISRLKDIFVRNKGETPVYFVLSDSRFQGVKVKASQKYHLSVTESVLEEIDHIVGSQNFLLTL